jgi:hypothetical protein
MSEKPEDQADKDPAPTKESDANRVTREEAEQVPGRPEDSPQEGSEQD